jgi:hypothetical protein
MVSALLMLRRVLRALRHAIREEDFLPLLSAEALLVGTGTLGFAFVAVETQDRAAGSRRSG